MEDMKAILLAPAPHILQGIYPYPETAIDAGIPLTCPGLHRHHDRPQRHAHQKLSTR